MTVRAKLNKKSGLYHVVEDEHGPVEEINAFLNAIYARGLSLLTVRAYAFDLVAVYRWLEVFGKPLTSLTQSDLLDFITHERNRGAQPASINRRLTSCRLLFEFWSPRGMTASAKVSLPSPFYRGSGRERNLGVHLIKKNRSLKLRVKEPKKLVTPLTKEQVCSYLSSLRRYRDIAIVHLMLFCGLRSREVLMLKMSDVSLLEKWVRVWGKGSKERAVPLSEIAAESIEQYVNHERPLSCIDDALFVSLIGKRKGYAMTPAGLRSIFRIKRKRANVSNANPHRFRHTFGTDMARSGMRLPVLQKLMGHQSPELTLRYINMSMSDIAKAYFEAVQKIQKNYVDE
jgi:integrase/recombinase XerD